LNIFHEIATGKRSVEDARMFQTQIAANYLLRNISSPYLERLLFRPQHHTADPDIDIFKYK
jgi:hypothetical protein